MRGPGLEERGRGFTLVVHERVFGDPGNVDDCAWTKGDFVRFESFFELRAMLRAETSGDAGVHGRLEPLHVGHHRVPGPRHAVEQNGGDLVIAVVREIIMIFDFSILEW